MHALRMSSVVATLAAFVVPVALAACSAPTSQPTRATAANTDASASDNVDARAASDDVVRVDVWHDTVCPWCRIGLHNLDAAVTQARAQGKRVDVVVHPFLLDPNAPEEGRDLRAYLAPKVGGEGKVDASFARVSEAGARSGVRFAWDKVKLMPSTVRSHALIAAAPDDKRAAVIEQLHVAHFEEGANIGDVEALVAVAKRAGMDEQLARDAVTNAQHLSAVRAAAREAGAKGIRGVPHIEVKGRVLRGAQSVDAIRAAL